MTEIKKICLPSTASILEAMKIIELYPEKIALIVSEKNQLLGTVTDGDIRRGLIRNISVNDEVVQIMNSKPITMPCDTRMQDVKKMLITKKISQIPLLNTDQTIAQVVLTKDLPTLQNKNNTVVLMAGGLGVRLGELTADCPKPMLKVGDKPILEVVIENLKEHGFQNFYIAVNYKAEVIENYFKDGADFGINIKYLREKERMGTAGSLSLLSLDNDLPLIVMNADVLTKVNFSQFIENHTKCNYLASMCVRNYDFQVPFGVVHVKDQLISKIEEKPTQSFFVNAGIYALNHQVLQMIPKDTFFDMPSLFSEILKGNKDKAGVFPIHEYWMDVGRRDDFNQAQVDYKKGFE
jgi:dTDP-glucose pyrophosphorylase